MIENYINQGLNIIAVNEQKQAIFPWKIYQTQQITQHEIDNQIADYRCKGIAVICGAVSGNLEVIDIDTKYQTYDLWDALKSKITSELYDKLQIVKTRNNGYHLYYRCEYIEKNSKLAQRHPTPDELKSHPQNKTYTIIETRGEGGYVVAPPSLGYEMLQDGINVITLDERNELMDICRSFNEVFDEVILQAHERPSVKEYGLSPFEDYNNRGDIVGLLANHGWKVVGENTERIYFLRPGSSAKHSGSFNKSMGLFSVFSVNTPFQVEKGYRKYAVYCILECNSDFKLAAKKLLDQGFGEKKTTFVDKVESELYKLKKDGASDDDLSSILVKKLDISISEAQKKVNKFVNDWGDNLLTFWDLDKHGNPLINRYKLQTFLTKDGGFKLYFYDNNSTIYRLIKVEDGFIYDASTEQVKKYIKNYIDHQKDKFDGGVSPQDILELVYKGSSILFSESFFEFFDRADINFLKDDKDTGYFPFQNGVVEVKKDSIKLKTYGELGKYIWKSQVIDHYITIDQDGINPENIEYFKFIKCISNNEAEKYMYCISLIGYLLHQYKDPARPFAVILAEENDNDEQGGGTGKGIFVKALSYILQTIRVDGKNFKIDKNFAFQRVDLDTKIIAIEDTRKKVDFEGFYSIITEGITVEKKNQDELFIPYKDSPKILFTTNYSIPQNGVHAKRRQRVFEFSPYFNQNHTPEDEFGHKLFDDWDKDEWNRFYNLFFFCLQDYLTNGVINIPFSEKMARKAIKNQFGDDFNEYLDEIVKHTEWISIDSLHQEFLNIYGMDKKEYSRIRFTKGLKSGMEIMKKRYEEKKDSNNQGKKVIKILKDTENEEKYTAF